MKSRPQRRSSWLVVWLRIAVGLALLGVLLTWVPFGEVLTTLARANPWWVASALGLFTGVLLLEAERFLVTFHQYRLSFRSALAVTFMGLFFGNFTPGLVGAEMYKVAYLGRRRDGLLPSVVLLTALRLLGILAVVAWAAVAVLAGPELLTTLLDQVDLRLGASGDRKLLLAVLGSLAVGLVLVVGLLWKRAWRERLVRLPRQILSALERLERGRLLRLGLLSLALGLLRIGTLVLLVRAFGASALSPAEAAVVVCVAVLALALPLSIGGLGVQEGAVAGLLTVFGVDPPQAVAVAILQRTFLWLAALVGGLLFALRRRTTDL